MSSCVCPGSYDPVTNGHLDVIERAAALFDEVTVAVLVNPGKSGLLALPERLELLGEVTGQLANVVVASFDGLLVDFCRDRGIGTVVKGLRGLGDVDHELSMAQMNHALTGVETLFLAADPRWSFVSSSLVKQVATRGGDVSGLVPDPVLERLRRLGG